MVPFPPCLTVRGVGPHRVSTLTSYRLSKVEEVTMARIAWTGRLRPEKVDEYVEAHANVWPEMRQMIHDAGVRNYSISLFGDRVFGYYECDDPEATKAYQAAAEVTKRWGEAMA